MNFGQYRLFLIRAEAKPPFFLSSTIPFKTQKPLSRITNQEVCQMDLVNVELLNQLTPLWCIALSYKRIMTTTLQLLLPVFLVTM